MEEINKKDLASREDIRQHTTRGKEQVRILYENIEPKADFNERTDFGDIEGLAQSILNEGQLFAIWVVMLATGKALLIAGERRYKAVGYLRSQGHDIQYMDAIIAPKNWDETDMLFFMAQENNGGKPFDDMELGRVFIRLNNRGISNAEISRRMSNMSEMIVGNRITAAKLTDREKASVHAGEVSLTAAVALAKRESNPAVRQAKIKEAVNEGRTLKVKDILDHVNKKPLPESITTPSQFNEAVVLTGECLDLVKTMNKFVVPGNAGDEYLLKLENKLRELKRVLSC
jgi:ParB-like chromosome segregation protein Spo0J